MSSGSISRTGTGRSPSHIVVVTRPARAVSRVRCASSIAMPARASACRSKRTCNFGIQAYEGFAHVDAFVVGAVLGPTLLAQGLAYFGESEDPPAHLEKNVLPFFQRDARRHLDEQLYVAFIQLGQKLGAETRERQHRQRRQDKCRGEHPPPAPEQP